MRPTVQVGGILLNRQRLARESRLPHVQVVLLQKPRVGGNETACRELDHIAGHQLGHRNTVLGTVANHRCSKGDLLAQVFDGSLCLEHLVEVQDHAHHDDRDDDHRFHMAASGVRHATCHEQYQHERVGEEPKELDDGPKPFGWSEFVWAEALEPLLRL